MAQESARPRMLDVLAASLFVVLVFALAVPAVLGEREQSRRGSCSDNLRQIGLGLQAYHQAHQVLPPNAAGNYVPDKESNFINWIRILLPYLHEEELAGRFNNGVTLSHELNRAAREARPARMLCPSDTFNAADNPYIEERDGRRTNYARGNYAMNTGTSSVCYFPGDLDRPCPNGFHTAWTPGLQVWGNGIGGLNKSFALRDFPSGLAKSVAVDEIRAGIRSMDSRGVWSLSQIGADSTATHGLYGDDGGPNCRNDRADDIVGCGDLHKVLTAEQLVREGMPCCWYCKEAEQATARSLHPSGVNVLTLDGSTHFLADNVDPNIWHAIHSRDQFDEFMFP